MKHLLAALAALLLLAVAPAAASAAIVTNSLPSAPLSGTQVVWTASADVTPLEIDFYIDGVESTQEGSAPYRYNGDSGYLNTTLLTDGNHSFKTTAFYSGGVTVSDTDVLNVQNGVTNSVTNNLPAAPLSGTQVVWTSTPTGATPTEIDFYIDGVESTQEGAAPYRYNGDSGYLNTTTLSDGNHTFKTKAFYTGGATVEDVDVVNVQNVVTLLDENFTGSSGSAPDPTKWYRYDYCDNWSLACPDPANATLDGSGNLKIVAKYEPTYVDKYGNGNYDYTTGRVESGAWWNNSISGTSPFTGFGFHYGRVDIWAKLPAATGDWSGLWLRTLADGSGHYGEIDISEVLSESPTVDRVHVHSWNKTPSSRVGTRGDSCTITGGANAAFHKYSVDWQNNSIKFYLDDVQCGSTFTSANATGSWYLDNGMNAMVILQLMVGGWPCDGQASPCPDSSEFPSTMLVDRVKVTQPV